MTAQNVPAEIPVVAPTGDEDVPTPPAGDTSAVDRRTDATRRIADLMRDRPDGRDKLMTALWVARKNALMADLEAGTR